MNNVGTAIILELNFQADNIIVVYKGKESYTRRQWYEKFGRNTTCLMSL